MAHLHSQRDYAAENVPETRTLFAKTCCATIERCWGVWERLCRETPFRRLHAARTIYGLTGGFHDFRLSLAFLIALPAGAAAGRLWPRPGRPGHRTVAAVCPDRARNPVGPRVGRGKAGH